MLARKVLFSINRTQVLVNIVKLVTTHETKRNITEAITEQKKLEYYKNLNAQQNLRPVSSGWDEALPFEAIPGPKPLPVLGNTWRFALPKIGDFYGKDMKKILELLNEKFGNIVILKGIPGHEAMVYIFDPADIETLHRNEGPWPVREGLPSFRYYRTETRKDLFQGVGGVLTVQGEDWFKFRSTVNSIIMNPRNVFQYVERMDKVASELVDNISYFASKNDQREMPENFQQELYKWALESISVVTLDKHLGCLKRDLDENSEAANLIRSTLEMFELMYKLDVLPSLWKVISTPTWRRYVKVLDYLTDINLKYINEVIKKAEQDQGLKSDLNTSVLEKLLAKDRKVAIAMATDMMIAGIDTTGRTLGTALYYLARYPEKQEQLRQEVLKLLPSKSTPITKETLTNAPYLNAIFKETTRMCPIAIGNLRTTVNDIVLGGYQIPKGTQIITNNLIVSNLDQHFPRAGEYLPERWLRTTKGDLSAKNANPFIYQPFGFGPRSCIGRRIAHLEIDVALLKIIRNFRLSWPHEDMTFSTRILHGMAKALKLKVTPLDS